MKKILYITTLSSTINAFLIEHLLMLKNRGDEVHCACFINQKLNPILEEHSIPIHPISFKRHPLHPQNTIAFKQLIQLQLQNHFDIIHVHTPTAALYGRLIKLVNPNVRMIYTVHGFHFHEGGSNLGWVIYYPIERIMAHFTDTLITINEEDYHRAQGFKVKNIYLVNGVGVKLEEETYSKSELRKAKGFSNQDFIILMIAELNKNKNHIQILQSAKKLQDRGIHVKVLCAGIGPMRQKIQEQIDKYHLDVQLLGFREDIQELIQLSDLGALVSYREGLPRSIMEFMANGKAIIGTNIRGIRDLVNHDENGFLVEVNDSQTMSDYLEILYLNRTKLDEMSKKSREKIKDYSLEHILQQLNQII